MISPSIHKAHRLTGHEAGIYAIIPGRRPGTFLSAAGDGWIVEWEVAQPEMGRLVAKVDVQIFALAYLPQTDTIIVGDMHGGVHWLNLSEDRPNKHIAHHKKGVFGILPFGEAVYTIGGEGVLTRWDLLRQRSDESLRLSGMPLRTLTHYGDSLAVGSSDHHIYLLDAETMTVNNKWSAHQNSVFSLQFGSNGQYLFSGSRDAHLKVWQAETGENISSQPAHLFTINDIIHHPSGNYLLTASRDRTIKIWDAHTFKLLKVLDAARDGGHVNSVNRLCWIPDTDKFISASDDRTLIIWEMK